MLTENELLKKLHQFIDKKFKRIKRDNVIDEQSLKFKMTLFAILEEFAEYDAKILSELLKGLVNRGSVETNLGQGNVHPFDAYFIPKSEII